MAYWLMKSEPGSWSWQQQVAKGAKGEAWSGVRNHQAKLNLMKMKMGDRAFFYHSGADKAVVGIVEIIRERKLSQSAAGRILEVDQPKVSALIRGKLDGFSTERLFRFLNALGLIQRAANLGDTRTLALHPASTIYHSYWPAQKEELGVPETLIRLSIGIEDADDLSADLAQALAAAR